MAFTSAQMETAWASLLTSLGESEWVDIISSTTGEYYRLPLTNGGLRHWNRTTGAWETIAVPVNLIAVTVRVL